MVESTPHVCPNLTARVSSDLGSEGLSFWSDLGGTQRTKSHAECSLSRCVANDGKYRSTSIPHVEKTCSCICIGPRMVDVMRIMDANMIPVVAFEASGVTSRVVVEAYVPGLDFTIISHSLGDCYNNTSENKLPACQVKEMQLLVSSLSSPKTQNTKRHWFWIDTLCVPLDHLKDPASRQIITRSMKSVSESAAQTLVLDSDIKMLSSRSEARELLIRIAYSSWSSRLWTLQEAVFTKRLVFQLSDTTTDLDGLMLRSDDVPLSWKPGCCARFPYLKLRHYLDDTLAGYQIRSRDHCVLLRKALEGRRTSDEVDEPIVIANLLGIDQNTIDESEKLSEVLGKLGFRGNLDGAL